MKANFDPAAFQYPAVGEKFIDGSDILTLTSSESKEVIRIDPEGRLFWHGREVETDDDFRAAMLDLAKYLKEVWR